MQGSATLRRFEREEEGAERGGVPFEEGEHEGTARREGGPDGGTLQRSTVVLRPVFDAESVGREQPVPSIGDHADRCAVHPEEQRRSLDESFRQDLGIAGAHEEIALQVDELLEAQRIEGRPRRGRLCPRGGRLRWLPHRRMTCRPHAPERSIRTVEFNAPRAGLRSVPAAVEGGWHVG